MAMKLPTQMSGGDGETWTGITKAAAKRNPEPAWGQELEVSASWNEAPAVNGGGWNDMAMKLPTQMSGGDGETWTGITKAAAKRNPEPAWGQELEGDAFPWTISLSQFSVYTLLGQQKSFSLVEPMSCTSTLAVTSHKLQALGHESRHSFVVCLHVDLESLEIKCSNPQVQLLYELSHSINTTWSKIQKRGILRQPSSYPEPTMGAVPTSPVRSSVDTAPPGTSTCSPSADFGTPTEDVTTTSVTDPQDAAVVSQEAAALLQKWAIRMIDPLQLEEGFYSRYLVFSRFFSGKSHENLSMAE
ncbi:UNVERIFIED_CONTAM: hypothetical protein FKN15_044085 [Acipenser sinensis]